MEEIHEEPLTMKNGYCGNRRMCVNVKKYMSFPLMQVRLVKPIGSCWTLTKFHSNQRIIIEDVSLLVEKAK